jgi:hypothetical protein
MKNIYWIFLTILLTLSSFISFAQFKVLGSGDYLILDNSDLSPETDYGITLGANNRFYNLASYGADFSNVNSSEVHADAGYFFAIYDMSDKRLKSNIIDLPNLTSDKLFSLRPVKYNLTLEKTFFRDSLKVTEKKMETTEHVGFIAQELKEVFPELVGENKEGMLGIKYTELIPILVQALKEQNEKIKSLEDRVSKLETGTKQ